jgi:hypothetical protein
VFELPLIRGRDSHLELTAPPRRWKIPKRKVARVSFGISSHPAVLLSEVPQDWRAYRYLDLDLYLEGEEPVEFVVRIKDVHSLPKGGGRFTASFDLTPGPSQLRIPLDDLLARPESVQLDRGKIHDVTIYLRKPDRAVTLYLADLSLSGQSGPAPPRQPRQP